MAFVGDIGTEIILEFQAPNCSGVNAAYSLAGATTITICVQRPDGTSFERAASFTGAPCGAGDGTDGKASLLTISGDFNQIGTYRVAGKVEFASGDTFYSSESTFKVKDPLCT
jgi:hypothetical protein